MGARIQVLSSPEWFRIHIECGYQCQTQRHHCNQTWNLEDLDLIIWREVQQMAHTIASI